MASGICLGPLGISHQVAVLQQDDCGNGVLHLFTAYEHPAWYEMMTDMRMKLREYAGKSRLTRLGQNEVSGCSMCH